jgi:peptidoglycan-N-acetylglucosamine deacetylase
VAHVACLTFDFDVVSSWIWRDQVTPTALSRGEFGLVGARRILDLLAGEGIATTWFIPGHTIESFPLDCRAVVEAGHEVGHHGYLHEPPAELGSRKAEAAVLDRSLVLIRELTGADPAGYRSPSWDLSPHTVELLLERGFVYDSSLMGDDYTPYHCRTGDVVSKDGPFLRGEPTALWEMPISWSLDDYPAFEYTRRAGVLQQGLMNARAVLENWVSDAVYLKNNLEAGVITYTMHPQVIGRGHRMVMLQALIGSLRDLGFEFRTMREALKEWQ